jgi:hypothetical protein
LFDPFLDKGELAEAKAAFAFKLAVAMFGLPWRHDASGSDTSNVFGAFFYVGVGEESKRAAAVGVMALGAFCEDDWSNVFGEGDRAGDLDGLFCGLEFSLR